MRTRASRSPHHCSRSTAACVLLCLAMAILPVAPSSGSELRQEIALLIQRGLSHLEADRYSDAINALEEAWEFDSTNIEVAEHLAFAYLYEHRPPSFDARQQALELMRFSLANGGRATFQTYHVHRGLQGFADEHSNCFGRLSLSPSGVDYLTELSEDSFSLPRSRVKEFKFSKRWQSTLPGAFSIQTDSERIRMRSINRTSAEAEMIIDLARRYVLGGSDQ